MSRFVRFGFACRRGSQPPDLGACLEALEPSLLCGFEPVETLHQLGDSRGSHGVFEIVERFLFVRIRFLVDWNAALGLKKCEHWPAEILCELELRTRTSVLDFRESATRP
jgi:hypothetical protein